MKISQLIQSIFLGLVLLGLFSIMAQNSYGFTLIGVSCFGLAALYLSQITGKLTEDFQGSEKGSLLTISELFLLALITALFGFRAFYIRIPYADIIFMMLCSLLLIVYTLIFRQIFMPVKIASPLLSRDTGFFYASVLIFLSAMVARILNPFLSSILGSLGLIASLPFLISLLRNKKYSYSGRSVTMFQFIIGSRHKAGMLFLFFIFSAVYVGLSTLHLVPTIGNTDKPPAYIELINQAETGREKPVNGGYKHEIFKEAMDKFLARHGNKSK
jgi:hypothetical protein